MPRAKYVLNLDSDDSEPESIDNDHDDADSSVEVVDPSRLWTRTRSAAATASGTMPTATIPMRMSTRRSPVKSIRQPVPRESTSASRISPRVASPATATGNGSTGTSAGTEWWQRSRGTPTTGGNKSNGNSSTHAPSPTATSARVASYASANRPTTSTSMNGGRTASNPSVHFSLRQPTPSSSSATSSSPFTGRSKPAGASSLSTSRLSTITPTPIASASTSSGGSISTRRLFGAASNPVSGSSGRGPTAATASSSARSNYTLKTSGPGSTSSLTSLPLTSSQTTASSSGSTSRGGGNAFNKTGTTWSSLIAGGKTTTPSASQAPSQAAPSSVSPPQQSRPRQSGAGAGSGFSSSKPSHAATPSRPPGSLARSFQTGVLGQPANGRSGSGYRPNSTTTTAAHGRQASDAIAISSSNSASTTTNSSSDSVVFSQMTRNGVDASSAASTSATRTKPGAPDVLSNASLSSRRSPRRPPLASAIQTKPDIPPARTSLTPSLSQQQKLQVPSSATQTTLVNDSGAEIYSTALERLSPRRSQRSAHDGGSSNQRPTSLSQWSESATPTSASARLGSGKEKDDEMSASARETLAHPIKTLSPSRSANRPAGTPSVVVAPLSPSSTNDQRQTRPSLSSSTRRVSSPSDGISVQAASDSGSGLANGGLAPSHSQPAMGSTRIRTPSKRMLESDVRHRYMSPSKSVLSEYTHLIPRIARSTGLIPSTSSPPPPPVVGGSSGGKTPSPLKRSRINAVQEKGLASSPLNSSPSRYTSAEGSSPHKRRCLDGVTATVAGADGVTESIPSQASRSWISTSDRVGDEVEGISSSPPNRFSLSPGKQNVKRQGQEASSNVVPMRSTPEMSPLQKKHPASSDDTLAKQDRKRSAPQEEEEEEELSSDESPHRRKITLRLGGKKEDRQKPPRKIVVRNGSATRKSARLAVSDPEESESEESDQGPPTSGSKRRVVPDPDDEGKQEEEDDPMLAMIRAKAAAKVAERRAAGTFVDLGPVVKEEPLDASRTQRHSSVVAQQMLSGLARSSTPLDKTPVLLASRVAKPEPTTKKNKFLQNLLKSRERDRQQGTNSAAMENITAEVLEGIEKSKADMQRESDEEKEEEEEQNSSDVEELDDFVVWDTLGLHTSGAPSKRPTPATEEGSATPQVLDRMRDLVAEIRDEKSPGDMSGQALKAAEKENDKSMRENLNVLDLLETDAAAVGAQAQHAAVENTSLRAPEALWTSEPMFVPRLVIKAAWPTNECSPIWQQVYSATSSMNELRALLEGGYLNRVEPAQLFANCTPCAVRAILIWLVHLSVSTEFHRSASGLLLGYLAAAESAQQSEACVALVTKVVFSAAINALRELGARRDALSACVITVSATGEVAASDLNIPHTIAAGTKVPLTRGKRVEMTSHVLAVFGSLADMTEWKKTPVAATNLITMARIALEIGRDPLEGNASECRALLQRIFSTGHPVPKEEDAAAAGFARSLFHSIKEFSFEKAVSLIGHLPAETPEMRQVSRWVSSSFFLHRLDPTVVSRHKFEVIEESIPLLLQLLELKEIKNPFHIAKETNYLEMKCAAELLWFCLSDLAIQMCSPKPDPTKTQTVLGHDPRTSNGQALAPFRAAGMKPVHDSTRLVLLEAIDVRLHEVSGRIVDHNGQLLDRSRARDALLKTHLGLRYMHKLFGNRNRKDASNFSLPTSAQGSESHRKISDFLKPLPAPTAAQPMIS